MSFDYLRPVGNGRRWSTNLAWSVAMTGADVRVAKWDHGKLYVRHVWNGNMDRAGLASAIREARTYFRFAPRSIHPSYDQKFKGHC